MQPGQCEIQIPNLERVAQPLDGLQNLWMHEGVNDQRAGPDLATREAPSNAFEKIGAANRVEAATYAARQGLVPVDGQNSTA